MAPDVTIPRALYDKLVEVLEGRMFTHEDDDEDNDYEVINVLIDLRRCGQEFAADVEDVPTDNRTPQELRTAGRPYCPRCYTFGDAHRKDCMYKNHGMTYHVRKINQEVPSA